LEFLKEAPQLSSITSYISQLSSFFDDDELCKYLNKMIKKLDFCKTWPCVFDNSDELTKFCQIFSNLEQLTCKINQLDELLYLLNHLTKLSFLKVYATCLNDPKSPFSRFQSEPKKQNIMFHIEPIDPPEQIVEIWTG
jgi:hypothetical protein